MKRSILSIAFLFAAVQGGRAQSIDPRQPAPLKAGLNGSMVDSTVGAQYWYFTGEPGHVDVIARWVRGQFDVGQPAPLDIAVFDENRSWVVRRQITPEQETSEARISLSFKQPGKTIISVTAPRGSLVRQGGDYELTVSGAAEFGGAGAAKAESIVRVYSNGDFGAVRFDANGTIEAEDGTRGSWRLFDAERHVYVVSIGSRRFSVKLMPGQGLVDPANPSSITFREVR